VSPKAALAKLRCRLRGHRWSAVFGFDTGVRMTVGVEWVRYIAANCAGIVSMHAVCDCCGMTEPCVILSDAAPGFDAPWLQHADGSRTLISEAGHA
jgi:hypothetical protein